jgi:hypothetical protein
VSLILSFLATPLIRRLNLNSGTEDANEAGARLALAKASLQRIDEMVAQADAEGRPLDPDFVEEVRGPAARRVVALKAGDTRDPEDSTSYLTMRRRVRRAMVAAERDKLISLRADRRVTGELFNKINKELDLREQALR